MLFTTFSSLLSFTLFAVLSTSSAVVIPIKGQNVAARAARRSLADARLAPSSLYRRTKGAPSHSGSQSGTLSRSATIDTKNAEVITVCHLPAASKGKRDFFDNILYGRTGTTGATDDDGTTLAELDPGSKHKVAAGPAMTGTPLGGGSFGYVYPDPSNDKQVIKHLGTEDKVSPSFPFTPGQLRREVKYLEKAKQLIKWEYTLKAGGTDLHEAWVWMKKIDGVSFKSLGFAAAGRTETLPVPKAFPRGQPARKVFLDHVVEMTVAKVVEYAKDNEVEHIDMNLGNIMIKFKAGSTTHEIESVDLVDWARARSVRNGCTPEKEAEIRARVTPYFARLY